MAGTDEGMVAAEVLCEELRAWLVIEIRVVGLYNANSCAMTNRGKKF
jgi:hypothetical protein